MDYADIYYVDPRNSDGYRDARVPGTPPQYAGRVPVRPMPAIGAIPASAPPAAAIGIVPPSYPQPAYPQPAYPSGPFGLPGYPAAWGSPFAGNLQAIVGGLGGLGSLADVIAQIFAAVMPMPQAPTPLGSNADTTDTMLVADTNANTKNLITYQSALASYAKRDEQIRTIGALLKKLVG